MVLDWSGVLSKGQGLSREAMESLGLVSNLDDRREASVRHISLTLTVGGSTSLAPAVGGGTGSHISRQFKLTLAADTQPVCCAKCRQRQLWWRQYEGEWLWGAE